MGNTAFKLRVHDPNHITIKKRRVRETQISLVARIIFPRRNIPKAFTLILNLLFCFVFIAAPFPNLPKCGDWEMLLHLIQFSWASLEANQPM